MNRRKILIGAGMFSTAVLAGCTDDGNQSDEESESETSDTEDSQNTDETGGEDDVNDDATDNEADNADRIEDQYFEGSGMDLIPDVRTAEGLIIAEVNHNGSEDFWMTLSDDINSHDLIRESGSYSGKRGVLVSSGESDRDTRELEVNADGDWELNISQPRPEEGEASPVQSTGSGPDVIGPYEFTGAHTLTTTHDGESNFQVIVYPITNDSTEIVVNTIGEYDDEQEFTYLDTGFVEINADGNWSVDIE